MAETNGAKKDAKANFNKVTLTFSGNDKAIYDKLLATAKENRRDLDQQILLELSTVVAP